MKRKLKPFLILAVLINLILFITKFYIGVRTNCLCIYTDSMNNLADTAAALFSAICAFIICIPPTERHPFGFGRLEYITGMIMAVIMTAAGLGFAYNSVERLFMPTPVWFFTRYAVIICVTCFVKLSIGIIFAVQYKKDSSPILKSVMLDSFLDTGITAVTLASFTLSDKAGFALDALLGLGISILIIILGIRLIVYSFSLLIGNSENEFSKKIESIVYGIDSNIKINRIAVHDYGRTAKTAELHLAYADESSDISVQNIIKTRLYEEFGISSVVEWEVNI